MIFSIEDGCVNRRNDNNDEKIFERIVTAYGKSKEVQRRSAPVYQVSNEWLPIYAEHLGRIMDVLARGDIVQLKSAYNNFFRDSCSSGLHGFLLDVPQNFVQNDIHPGLRERYFNDLLHRFKLWWELMEMTCPLADLQSPLIGNPYGYTIDGQFIRAGADYQHYYSSIIGRLIRGPGHKTVIEIGGGFGGMAYYLMRDSSDLTYLDFDLPENVALTSFYLLTAFPDKEIALFGEVDMETTDIQRYDAVLMPSFEMHKLRNDSVDLTFNSYSLAELSRETVDDYISHINRFTSKFIFHVNHTKVSLVKSSDFGISKEKFELVFRSTALWNASRNTEVDEFEYLYKNKNMYFKRDSSKTL